MNSKIMLIAIILAASLMIAEATIKIRIHKKPISIPIPTKISLGLIGHDDWWGQSWGGSWSSWPSWGWGWQDDAWW
uniref:Uncharacterized protein n=1 Tax=Tetranychus urticae TaxID=32264 RepID=T1KI46_TETUR